MELNLNFGTLAETKYNCGNKITNHRVSANFSFLRRIIVILGLGFPSSRRFSPAIPKQSKLDSARSQDSSSSSTRFVTAQRLAALIMHILYPEKRIRPLTLLRTQLYRERSFILRRFTSLTKFHTKFVLVKRARQTHTRIHTHERVSSHELPVCLRQAFPFTISLARLCASHAR